MPKQIPHSIRYPDYSISFSQIGYPSTAHYVLSYANFKKQPFTYADHMKLRGKPIRNDMWCRAASKLVDYGWLMLDGDTYQITPAGHDACKRIAARNACRPNRKVD